MAYFGKAWASADDYNNPAGLDLKMSYVASRKAFELADKVIFHMTHTRSLTYRERERERECVCGYVFLIEVLII